MGEYGVILYGLGGGGARYSQYDNTIDTISSYEIVSKRWIPGVESSGELGENNRRS